jgi:outer membrane protein
MDRMNTHGLAKYLLAFLLLNLTTTVSFADQTIDLPNVLQKVLDQAYEVKLAAVDISISKADLKRARSEYLPTLNSRFNSEYVSDLTPNSSSSSSTSRNGFNVVGGTSIISTTMFQNSTGLNLNYNLFDWGIRRKTVQSAKSDIESKVSLLSQRKREVLTSTIDAYGTALLNSIEIALRQQIADLGQERFKLKTALYQYGSVSKLEVSDSALVLAQNMVALEGLKQEFISALKTMSLYTRESYGSDTRITPIESQDQDFEAPVKEALPEYVALSAEINKKKNQVDILLRQRYAPQVAAYSNYFLYGSNPNNIVDSFSALEKKSANFGVSISLPLFDGFKNSAERDRAKHELEKLKIQRDQAVDRFYNDFEKNKALVQSLKTQVAQTEVAVNQQEEKKAMIDRLSAQQMVEKAEQLQAAIGLLTEKISLQKAQARQAIAQQKLIVLGKGGA